MLAEYYRTLYLILCTILTFVALNRYSKITLNSNRGNSKSRILLSFAITCFLIVLIGLRPISPVFVDMVGYAADYNQMYAGNFYFDFDVDNLLFDNFFEYLACNTVPLNLIFLIFAFIYFIAIFIGIRKLFPNDTLLALVCYLSAFSTFSYATNGVKAGMAAAIFLIALAYHEKTLVSILLALLTYGMHHSMILVVVAYLVVLCIRNPKYYFLLWGLSFLISALHITYFQHLFIGFTDDHGADYLIGLQNSGFRLDFIIYSAVPVIVGYYLIFKYKIISRTYNLILSLYLLTNSVWMLCMYSNSTNRIAYLSWFLYPIVLLYPFLCESWSNKQAMYLKYFVWGHIGFTLFMNLIYYR